MPPGSSSRSTPARASLTPDYDRFYRRRARSAVRSEPQPDQRETGDPLKLAYLFAGERTGHKVSSIAFVNSKDVADRQAVPDRDHDRGSCPSFLDFALEAASRTNFNVQTLGGLRQYLAPYKARQAAAASAKRMKNARTQEENDRLAYDRSAVKLREPCPGSSQRANRRQSSNWQNGRPPVQRLATRLDARRVPRPDPAQRHPTPSRHWRSGKQPPERQTIGF